MQKFLDELSAAWLLCPFKTRERRGRMVRVAGALSGSDSGGRELKELSRE